MEEKPLYEHDCTQCRFLGRYHIPVGLPFEGDYDLYWCPQIEGHPTVIARWSSHGPDNLSGMPLDSLFFEKHPAYPKHEAYRRAQALGYEVGKMKPMGTTLLFLADRQ